MANITVADVQAWVEPTKLAVSSIDASLESQVAQLVLSQLAQTFPVSSWTTDTTTPKLVRTIMAMHYMAWLYDKHYAQEEEASAYAATLRRYADANILGLTSGTLTLEGYELAAATFTPSFFPNDASSANAASSDFPSDGDASFMMGTVF